MLHSMILYNGLMELFYQTLVQHLPTGCHGFISRRSMQIFPTLTTTGFQKLWKTFMGLDPNKFSTANDGIRDGAKVEGGMDPRGNRPS